LIATAFLETTATHFSRERARGWCASSQLVDAPSPAARAG
jgi:hypothetical protein